MRDYYLGGTQVAVDAIVAAIRRQLAVELGPHGVRVVTLASGGAPESLPEGCEGREKIVEMIERQTLLGRAATLEAQLLGRRYWPANPPRRLASGGCEPRPTGATMTGMTMKECQR